MMPGAAHTSLASGGSGPSPGILTSAALLAVGMAACNYPVDAPTASPTALELGEIEAMVGATLMAEAELTPAAGTPTPTDTPGPDSASANQSPTPSATLSATPTATPQPTDPPQPTSTTLPSNTPQPTNPPPPSATSQPTNPPLPSDTPIPSPTPCDKFTNPSLSAKADIQNQVSLSWNSSGGCEPITGEITATYKGDRAPYATHQIKGKSGTIIDRPEPRCEGTFTINYGLVLVDAAGVSLSTSTEIQINWSC